LLAVVAELHTQTWFLFNWPNLLLLLFFIFFFSFFLLLGQPLQKSLKLCRFKSEQDKISRSKVSRIIVAVLFTGWMPFLSPNQQHQSFEG